MALSQEELTAIAYQISERFEKVNTFYLMKMAKQMKEIGQLSPSNLHRIEQMIKMSQNIEEINLFLAKQTNFALEDIYRLYEKSGIELYKDVAYLYGARGINQVPFSKNVQIQNYIKSIQNLTKGTFQNMANTTVISSSYRDVIDLGITKVSEGVEDYYGAIRDILKSTATTGMRVQYSSGYTRRLDSAVRMNILEGVRQINYGIRKECGNQYGADGVEIDAHSLCAEDHLPYQGKQYSLKRYNAINDNLRRQFGTCNCQHGISYIILGVSPPTYPKEELKDMQNYSNEKIQIGDKEVTRYEASQLMRQLETQMRYKKDEIITLRTAGCEYKKESQRLRDLQKQYNFVSKASGLKKRYERAYVPGFK